MYKQEIWRPSWNTVNCPRPQTTLTWVVFMPQTSTVPPRERESVSSSRNVRKTVRNFIRKTPHFIALFVVKTKSTPLGSTKSSRQGLKVKKILNIQKIITRISSKK